MQNEYISQDTTLMANSNQFVKNFKMTRNNINFALLAKALDDYDFLMQHLDEKFYLEQMIRAEAAEIDKLKQEEVDLRLRLDDAREQSSVSELQAEETSAQLKEQQVMIQKLLHAIKTSTSSISTKGVPFEFKSLFAEFSLPHSATLEPLRFHKPEMLGSRCKHGLYDCRVCNAALSAGEDVAALLAERDSEDNTRVLAELGARIDALQAERDSVLQLLQNRMASVEAAMCTQREQHAAATCAKDKLVAEHMEALLDLTRKKQELDRKSVETEKNMAQLMGKAAAAAQKARDKTQQALKQAETQLKNAERGRQAEVQQIQRDCKMREAMTIEQSKAAVSAAEGELQRLEEQVSAREARFAALERRLRSVCGENRLLGETIRTRINIEE